MQLHLPPDVSVHSDHWEMYAYTPSPFADICGSDNDDLVPVLDSQNHVINCLVTA
jgi:hypothetical protein